MSQHVADWAVLTTGICDECTTAINCGDTVPGTWTSNCPSDHRPGSYAKYYTFEGTAGQLVTIDLMSSVDTYLFLLDPSGNVEAYDDDGGTGVNSRISNHALLSSGTYTIEATTYASGQTGTFNLSLECGGEGFDSQFNGSEEGWDPVTGTWYIEDNAYYASEGNGVGVFASTSYYANFSNFIYEVMLWRDGDDYYANSIIIRGDPSSLGQEDLWANCYLFQYTRGGDYLVAKLVNGVAIALQFWTYSPAISVGDAWNLLSVIANGSSLLFYINGTLVWSGTDASFSSGQVGIAMYCDASSGEKLRAHWAVLLEGPFPASLTTQVVSDEQQALNAAANKLARGSIKGVDLIRKDR